MAPASPVESPEPSLVGSIRRVVANLVFDGRQPLAAAGLRGAADAYALVYSVDDVDVDLQIEPASPDGGRWLITGQVSVPSGAGAVSVEAVSRPLASAAAAEVDQTGMFSLILDAGTYDLVVHVAERGEAIVLSGIGVG
jgi:hypothetical protein